MVLFSTALVYHVPEALENYLKDIGISQVERKNYDQHIAYFQSTSKRGSQKGKESHTAGRVVFLVFTSV